jgi:hypothetical protein
VRRVLRQFSGSDEGACVVLGKSAHVTRVNACDFTDMWRDRFGFTAGVMRVVLDKAVDLPRRHVRRFHAPANASGGPSMKDTGRPMDFERALAISACVTAAGPVIV